MQQIGWIEIMPKSAIHLAVQIEYSRWLEARGIVPTFWDIAGLPDGFERFYCQTLQICVISFLEN